MKNKFTRMASSAISAAAIVLASSACGQGSSKAQTQIDNTLSERVSGKSRSTLSHVVNLSNLAPKASRIEMGTPLPSAVANQIYNSEVAEPNRDYLPGKATEEENKFYESLGAKSLDEIVNYFGSSKNPIKDAMRFMDANFKYVSDADQYVQEEHVASFNTIYGAGWKDDCDGAVIVAGRLLKAAGFEPYNLVLTRILSEDEAKKYGIEKNQEGQYLVGHGICAVHDNAAGKWAAVGFKSEHRLPAFDSVFELVADINKDMISKKLAPYQMDFQTRLIDGEYPNAVWISGVGDSNKDIRKWSFDLTYNPETKQVQAPHPNNVSTSYSSE